MLLETSLLFVSVFMSIFGAQVYSSALDVLLIPYFKICTYHNDFFAFVACYVQRW